MYSHRPLSSNHHRQGRLYVLAALFLFFYTLAITLSPAVRARSWDVPLRWEVWAGYTVWVLFGYLVHQQSTRYLPDHDPYLLPVAALLSGWGLMTIWRLDTNFGLRQTAWLGISNGLLLAGFHWVKDLSFLQRYKYLWLTGGLFLTGMTLILGTNPLGYGPRMWLGCCGIYLQPSEPLKFLLIAYLAAYLADRHTEFTLSASLVRTPRRLFPPASILPLIAPSLIMTCLALILLVIQRDLGTAAIFFFLYAILAYLGTGRRRILLFSGLMLMGASLVGAGLFDVVRLRFEAWINPWIDPSGRSYQIVQALLAIANGGLFGRGPGLGNPNLVPVAHSDFIFSALTEETGFFGSVILFLLLAILVNRGIRAAFRAQNPYQRLLAAGFITYLVGQSLLIIGGNLRLLPLTGVTLPFLSYGGSSLVTSYLSLFILIIVSNQSEDQTLRQFKTRPYLQLSSVFFIGLTAMALATGWWTIYRSSDLLARTDNPRRAIADRYVQRGAILDRNNTVLNETVGEISNFLRQYRYPDLSSILGYTHPVFGQSGLEASQDNYLRGLKGNPGWLIEWNQLLYGQPPEGRTIRLTLDLHLQTLADQQLGPHTGVVILLNAHTGEILALASHPTFDANRLNENWAQLVNDPQSPLLNRATQGLYPVGAAVGPLLLASLPDLDHLPELPEDFNLTQDGIGYRCISTQTSPSWSAVIKNGCPTPVLQIAEMIGLDALQIYLESLGFFSNPLNDLLTVYSPEPTQSESVSALIFKDLRASPLQMALGIATINEGGFQAVPSLVGSVNTLSTGWVHLSPKQKPKQIFTSISADTTRAMLADNRNEIWQITTVTPNGAENTVSWFLGGTLSTTTTDPWVIVVLVEEDNPELVARIGQEILLAAPSTVQK